MTNFDYIIIGAGSAGCVLARRLTENTGHKVLLLEAGGSERRLFVQLPIGYGKTFYDPTVNWMYRTEAEPALAGRRGYWPRGKVLGGSSSINAMVYVRGQDADFDDWERAGNPGWGARDLLGYFRRMEDFSGGADDRRGAGGPLHVADVSRDCHPLCQSYLRACEEIGLARNPDYNGACFEGVGFYQITMQGGLKASAARAYLRPAMRQAGLHVEVHAHVLRILCEDGRAVGVEYVREGQRRQARAASEVILCAGAINSPQLLQLSGIGAAALLQRHGIAVVQDRPAVGRNLQDHLCIDHIYRSRLPTLNQVLGSWTGRIEAALRYAFTRRGPLSLSLNQAGGFVRSRADSARADLQLYFCPVSYTRAVPGRRALMRPDRFPGLLLGAQPCRPTGRGYVEIASADPHTAPRIVPNSLASDHDVAQMLECGRLLRKLSTAPALAAIIEAEMLPGADVVSDAELLDDVRRRCSTVFHPVGSCAMGEDARTAVVDSALRVHGMRGLRVIDASIFPQITSGNTNAPTIMVAEKGADLVLADARQRIMG